MSARTTSGLSKVPGDPIITSLGADPHFDQALTAHLAQYITENRRTTIERVLDHRTRHITIVLENIYQSHNASAVVRTCECMGLQDLHIIESKSKYGINKKVLKGSNKWITMKRYKEKGIDNTESCLRQLRQSGYRILAMDPSPDGESLESVSVDSKIALVMGNELKGLSDSALQHSDAKVRVPMSGFTESLNISVCAAISMNILLTRTRAAGLATGLSNLEKDVIRLEWYRKCVRGADIIEREFAKSYVTLPT